MTISLKERTQQGLQQIQRNARTLKEWDDKLQNYDEVFQSLDRSLQEKFGAIPAEFGAQTSPPDFSKDPLSTGIQQSHQQNVTNTDVLEAEIIESVEKNDVKNQNWVQSFKQALSSESIQNQLQKFKDKVSQQTVQVGNQMASLPDELATKSLMKTVAQKFDEGQSLLPQTEPQSGYNLGDYKIIRSGFQRFSLLDKNGQEQLKFKRTEQGEISLLEKGDALSSSAVLAELKNESVELTDAQKKQRVQLVNRVNAQIQKLDPGQRVGAWTVRTHQGEKFLDKPNGHEISRGTLPTLPYQTLDRTSKDIQQVLSQQQCDQCMPVLAQVLKAKQSLNFQGQNTKINFNPHEKTLTLETQNGETLVARSLGKNKWEYVSGGLSEATVSQITTTVAPQVEKHLKQVQQDRKNQKTLASLT